MSAARGIPQSSPRCVTGRGDGRGCGRRAAACWESERSLCLNSGRGKVVMASALGVQLLLTRSQKLGLQFRDVAGL